MEPLEKLFGGMARVRLMRLFLFNPEKFFTIVDLVRRAGITSDSARREISHLVRAGFIKKRASKSGSGKKKNPSYGFNSNFPYLHPLKNLLIEATPLRSDLLIRRLNKVGKLKLVVISGLLMQEPESRLDLLIVGDRLNKGMLDRTMQLLESEIGKELRYAVFETSDFTYRLNVYDKLLRDVFDYPHEKILVKMELPSFKQTYPQATRQPELDGVTL